MKINPGAWCIPDAPKQHGDLWVWVTEDQQVRVLNPAGAWWRDRVFATLEDFRKVFQEASK